MKLLHVSVAVSSLREGLSAVDAGVRPLSRVDPHVHVELVFADEALVAAGAGVWLVPRVVTLVHLQLSLSSVGAPTLGTLELRPHLHVLPTVELQTAARAEALGALVALEGLVTGMDVDVELEAGGRGEAVATNRAEVRSLPGVDAHVLLQLVFVEEASRADRAAGGLFSLVFGHVFSQFCQRCKGPVTARAGVWPLFLELLVSEAVVIVVLFMLKTLEAAGALVGPFVYMSAQVVLKCIHFDKDCVAMWTPVLSLLVNCHMSLEVRLFLEKLVTLGTIIKTVCMSFLVLL